MSLLAAAKRISIPRHCHISPSPLKDRLDPNMAQLLCRTELVISLDALLGLSFFRCFVWAKLSSSKRECIQSILPFTVKCDDYLAFRKFIDANLANECVMIVNGPQNNREAAAKKYTFIAWLGWRACSTCTSLIWCFSCSCSLYS